MTEGMNTILAVDEDDIKYLIYTTEEMSQVMKENPEFPEEFRDMLYERWILARDCNNDPVWLNINHLKRLEFKRVKIVKG
jgi:hypothetical protein